VAIHLVGDALGVHQLQRVDDVAVLGEGNGGEADRARNGRGGGQGQSLTAGQVHGLELLDFPGTLHSRNGGARAQPLSFGHVGVKFSPLSGGQCRPRRSHPCRFLLNSASPSPASASLSPGSSTAATARLADALASGEGPRGAAGLGDVAVNGSALSFTSRTR